jgi:hypothetical protein
MRGEGSCGASVNEYSFAHGAQINFGDLTPYLTYGLIIITHLSGVGLKHGDFFLVCFLVYYKKKELRLNNKEWKRDSLKGHFINPGSSNCNYIVLNNVSYMQSRRL